MKLLSKLNYALLTFLSIMFLTSNTLAQSWQNIPGVLGQDIGVGRTGTVWVTATNSDIYRFSNNTWEKIPGAANRVAVDPAGDAWVVNAYGDIYKYDATTRYWQIKPGNAKDIGISGGNHVWVIGSNPVPGGYGIYKWNWDNSTWTNIPGGAVRIAVDPSGNAWVVNSSNNIFRYNGSTFEVKPGAAKDIGIGANGVIWCIGTDDRIYQWDNSTNNWKLQTGAATNVTVGPDGNAWVVNSAGMIWRTTNPVKLPDFNQNDIKGIRRSLYNDLSNGKAVVLDFSAAWCGPCNISAPKIQTLYTDLLSRNCKVSVYMMLFEGRMMGVASDSTAGVAFATRLNLTFPILTNIGTFYSGLTGQFTSQYMQSGVPFFIIITPNTKDPANSTVQIISGDDENLVQLIKDKLPPGSCN